MELRAQAAKTLSPLMWVTAAIILFSVVGTGVALSRVPAAVIDPGDRETPELMSENSVSPAPAHMNVMPTASSFSAHPRIRWCQVCGVVLSMRAVNTTVAGNETGARDKRSGSHAITVRFDDGSIRVISELKAPMWRMGQKVKVINGVIQADA